jgi:murein DD-endopeptidase MepM/ murein hydrolase activator NlpD
MSRSKNTYKLPLKLKDITHWHKRSSSAHVGKYKHSLDFYAPKDTPIRAALEGEVVWIRDNFKVGGASKKYYYFGNRIVLKHKNNEYSAYEHNKYHSANVKVGQKVRRGQIIALVGSTGWSTRPHVHFEVFTNPDKDKSEGKTLQVVFGIQRIGKCVEDCYV